MINIDDYCRDFVRSVTSDDSNFATNFTSRIQTLDKECNAPLLLTATIGLSGEIAEIQALAEYVPVDEDHMAKELGDVIWYWVNACRALSILPSEIIDETRTNQDSITCIKQLAITAGYFSENVKKTFFHGKELNKDSLVSILSKLYTCWDNLAICYWFTPEDIIELNVNKLKARYPGGEFDAYFSENRVEGDV